MTPELAGTMRPSSDTKTPLLYKTWDDIETRIRTLQHLRLQHAGTGGMEYSDLPDDPPIILIRIFLCARLTDDMIQGDYEYRAGIKFSKLFLLKGLWEMEWFCYRTTEPIYVGNLPKSPVYNAAVLEEVAAWRLTLQINPQTPLKGTLACKHFERKHGKMRTTDRVADTCANSLNPRKPGLKFR